MRKLDASYELHEKRLKILFSLSPSFAEFFVIVQSDSMGEFNWPDCDHSIPRNMNAGIPFADLSSVALAKEEAAGDRIVGD